ncbi:MAG: gliding motility lipoprotein GldH [Bacteroidetes bacterium]|nr:gliding motility lipoprotein GldH [Bacteroidota bacterium]
MRFSFFYFLLFLLVFSSCDSKRFFEENKTIPKSVWNRYDKIRFDVIISDTTAGYDIYLNVRNDMSYQFANLYFFLETQPPSGRIYKDTVECPLADYNGKWKGKGFGSIKFNRLLFEKGVRFRMAGKYTFEFEQAMRVVDLQGIKDIGLRIEKE